ncbi:MAG: ribonuclease H family protein [Bacteroidales bacterium]|nr:ribonuclease H family protein [Bacteroidales bacterium]
MAKKKYYVVWKGIQTGIFSSWDECREQISGFHGAVYKSFASKEMAEIAFKSNSEDYLGSGKNKNGAEGFRPEISKEQKALIGMPVQESLSVDAACKGNPGILEYRGVDTKSGIELFKVGPFPEGTVNIGEFLALVHGLAYLEQRKSKIPVYSDSKTAIKWLKDKKIKTKLEQNLVNAHLFELIDRAINWIKNNKYENEILKWETAYWGEIPADFGRK